MLKRQLVHESQRRATKNRGVATRLQPGAATQFVRLLVACSLCTYTSGDGGMRKASAWMLEKGIHTPSPSPDLIPAGNNKTLAENLHGNWNIERGHFTHSPPRHSAVLGKRQILHAPSHTRRHTYPAAGDAGSLRILGAKRTRATRF